MVGSVISDVMNGAAWRKAWRVLLVAALVCISWLAFTPNPPPAADLGWDKANHFAAFGTLAFLGMQCLQAGGRRAWWVLAGLLAYGVLIELVQSRIPGRDADARDVVADMIGAGVGLVVHTVVVRVLARLLPALNPVMPR